MTVDGEEVESRHTRKKRSHNPVWNQGFLFDVNPDRIENHTLIVLKVMNYDLLLRDEVIGHVIVGPREEGSGRQHWQEMMKKKHVHREVAIIHVLQWRQD